VTGSRLFLQYAMAFAVPLVATLWLTPAAAWVAHRFGILDHPGEGRFHSRATPYLGGLALACGLALVGAFTASASGQLLTILVGGIALMFVGLADDYRGLGPAVKLVVEVGAAVGLWLVGVRAGMFGVAALDCALTILWVVAITNALNLLDNMDGLAAGVTAIASVTFFAVAARQGDYLVGSFALALAGASLGFLRHNFPPARIFLGDAGSLMLGFLLASLALKLDLIGQTGFVHLVVPALILGVPIFDTLLVIIARVHESRPIFLGGTDHSSHRLTELGFSSKGAAAITYLAQLCASAVAFALVYAPRWGVAMAVFVAGLIAAFLLVWFLKIELTPKEEPGLARNP